MMLGQPIFIDWNRMTALAFWERFLLTMEPLLVILELPFHSLEILLPLVQGMLPCEWSCGHRSRLPLSN